MKFVKCEDVYGPGQYINLEQVCKIDTEYNKVYLVNDCILELSDEEMEKLINVINIGIGLDDSTVEKLRKAFELNRKDLEIFDANGDINNSTWCDGYRTGFYKAMKIIGIDTSEWGK